MTEMIDELIERLVAATVSLEQVVRVTDSEPEDWLSLLDERDEIIERIKQSGKNSTSLSNVQQQQFEKIQDINERLLPIINERMQGVQQQLNNVQRSKLAMNSYNEVGPNGYGAFFDRKK
ncbi:flagellar protein FliT [Brevibacillus reuszeri]|uniref:flagellar protein FliT n=1 Tax=Brevibacillus reuszeri TaxID=54915 RepID=UPI002898E3F4|nr:flagellar protein FliT [Brevibacillus reuszeri]